MRTPLIGLLLTLLLGFQCAHSARIYFTDQPAGSAGFVMSVAPDGTGQQIVTSGFTDLRGVAFHRASGRVYFLDNATDRIYSILPNGSDRQEVLAISTTAINSDLEIDEGAGKLYWSESNAGAGNAYIQRADLDGSNVENVVTTAGGTLTTPYFIFVEPVGAYVYWGTLSSSSISSTFRRATLAGVIDPQFMITSPTRTRDIAVDPRTATAYWCDRQTGTIFKRALSGGANQTVIAGMNAPHGIAIDLEAEKVYWADTGARESAPFNTSARSVARCNFDGTEFERLSTPAANSEAWDLALDTRSPTYADWRARFFSKTSPAAGPSDDADGDRAPNLLEYATGTNPRNSASVPLLARAGTGVEYIRRRDANLQFRVEVSTDLVNWHYNEDDTSVVWTTETNVTAVNEELDSVVLSRGPGLSDAAYAFFRVRASMP
jgi:hypothetical protein